MANQDINVISSFPPMPAGAGNSKRTPVVEWLIASDRSRLGCRVWQGDNSLPVVLYLHGVEGHSQWFENTASVLNERGITVYAPDRRGSGANGQLRGHLSDYHLLLSDLESHVRHIRRQNPSCRIVLMANCWSAKFAALFVQDNYKSTDQSSIVQLDGLILTSPAIYTRIDIPLRTKCQIAFNWLRGGDSKLKLWPLPIATRMLTNNPQYLEFLEKDPLRLKEATTSFLVQTYFLTLAARKAAPNINLPVLILQAGMDEIVDVQKLEGWYEKISAKDKALHVFPEVSHSLDFDNNWFVEYTRMLINWIVSRQ